MNAKFNIVLADSLLEQIDLLAREEGVTKSAFIRNLIKDRIEAGLRQEIEALKARVNTIEEKLDKIDNPNKKA